MINGFLQLLLLIIIANGAPIIFARLLSDSFDLAVDFGQQMPDNKPIFGASKTWRGVVAALCATALTAWLLGYAPATGIWVAVYAIVGDLLSSFVKRRLSMPSSSMAPMLDQVPESLLPAYMMMELFGLDGLAVILLVLTFIILELGLSLILYRWGVRKRPF